MKRLFLILFLFAALALTIEIGHNVYFLFTANSSDPSYKIILVEPGKFGKTAEMLFKEGLVKDPKRFTLLARLLRISPKVRVGEYEVRMNMSPYELIKIMTSGKSVLHPVHIPEGYNIEQIADVLEEKNLINKEEFLKLARDPHMAKILGIEEKTLEGYLYPETYSFTHFTGDRVILKTMVEKFKEVYNREVKFGAEKIGWNMHDVVTLASVIEKETGAPQERPVISSVFHNRLKVKMPLQSDPTVIYGKSGDKKNITREDLITPNPYNTYTKKGLPIGPISNPGKDSMLAVIEPAQTKFIYFVSKNDGTHFFSVTFAEHNKAVQKFQRDARARAGKSWRDLKKSNSAKN